MQVLKSHIKILDFILRAEGASEVFRGVGWLDHLLQSGGRMDVAVQRWLLWSRWWKPEVMVEEELVWWSWCV